MPGRDPRTLCLQAAGGDDGPRDAPRRVCGRRWPHRDLGLQRVCLQLHALLAARRPDHTKSSLLVRTLRARLRRQKSPIALPANLPHHSMQTPLVGLVCYLTFS